VVCRPQFSPLAPGRAALPPRFWETSEGGRGEGAGINPGSSAFFFAALELRPKPFDLGQRFTMALFGLTLLLLGLLPRLHLLRGALLGQLGALLGLALRLRRFLLRRE